MSSWIKSLSGAWQNAAHINRIFIRCLEDKTAQVVALCNYPPDQLLFQGTEDECLAYMACLEQHLDDSSYVFSYDPKPIAVPEPLEESEFPPVISEFLPNDYTYLGDEDYKHRLENEARNEKTEQLSLVALAGLLASGNKDPVKEAFEISIAVFDKLNELKNASKAVQS